MKVYSVAPVFPPAGAVPAGVVPTSGPTAARQPAGRRAFTTNVQLVGVIPRPMPAFADTLRRTLREVGLDATLEEASATVGARGTEGSPRGPIVSVWVRLEGVLDAPAPFETVVFNRAIARAFAQSANLRGLPSENVTTYYRDRVPADGAQLLIRLSQPDACEGAAPVIDEVYARACTRFGELPPVTPIGSPAVTPTPIGGPAVTPTPIGGPAVRTSPQPAISLCPTRIVSPAWLRDRATFDPVGPLLPAGTSVSLGWSTGITGRSPSGTPLTIFRVYVIDGSHAGESGYAALSAADTAGCATLDRLPVVTNPILPTRPEAPAPPAPVVPLPVRPPAPAPAAPAQPREAPTLVRPTAPQPPAVQPQVLVPAVPQAPQAQSGVRWYWWALGALAVGGLGVAVWKRRAIAAWWRSRA